MKILIVCENFSVGGLETQIIGQIQELQKKNFECFLAIGNSLAGNREKLDGVKVVENLNFKVNATNRDIYYTINKLVEIIKENNIDIVHIHPYISCISAFIAAKLTNVKAVVTFHGPTSFRFQIYGQLYDTLMKEVFFKDIDLVFSVSEETKLLSDLYLKDGGSSLILRNGINLNKFKEFKIDINAPLAVISRLDKFKVEGIKDCFEKLAQFIGSKEIHVYGEGENKEELEKLAKSINLNVKFMGQFLELHEKLKDKYSVIIGMGRVVLEGTAMNIPTLLVGYDGVKGFLNEELINKAKWWNYSGRGVNNITASELEMQFSRIYDEDEFKLREWISKNANEKEIWNKYVKTISEIDTKSSSNGIDFYNLIKANLQDNIPMLKNINIINQFNYVLKSKGINITNLGFSKFYSDERDRLLIREAMLSQSLLENRVKFEEKIKHLENQLNIYKQDNHKLLQSEAFVRQNLVDNQERFDVEIRKKEQELKSLKDLNCELVKKEAILQQKLLDQREVLEKKNSEMELRFKNELKKLENKSESLNNELKEKYKEIIEKDSKLMVKEKELKQKDKELIKRNEELIEKTSTIEMLTEKNNAYIERINKFETSILYRINVFRNKK